LNLKDKSIVVTGGNGFLGSKIVFRLKQRGAEKITIPNSKTCDLRIRENCENITKNSDIVFHIAAKVGGIGLNLEKPGELFYDNIMMGTNLMEESRKNGVEKFVALGTVCSYPKFTPIPFSEESIWDGYPEETNAPYGLAKKMLLVQSQAYRQQYDFHSIMVIPTNLYGPGDNFDENSSHVIAALIKKIFQAKKLGSNKIEVWGDGTPTRDFLYVDDAANGIILAAEKYDKSEPLNLGSGKEISIKDLVSLLLRLMNTSMEIEWQTDKPNGQPRRCVSSEHAKKEIGFEPNVSIEDGLKSTIESYENNLSG